MFYFLNFLMGKLDSGRINNLSKIIQLEVAKLEFELRWSGLEALHLPIIN